jgi:hypothetical protein
VGRAFRSDLGVLEPFFYPGGDSLAAHTEGPRESAQARAFLVSVENGLFFLVVVGVGAGFFAVLFAAGFALVALPAVGCANARQVLGYEQEAKPYLRRSSFWQ